MKKTIRLLGLSILFFSQMLFMLSCSFLKNEDEMIEEKVQNLISYLDNDDKEGIKSLFAEKQIENNNDFELSLNDLVEYYDGTSISKIQGSMGTDKDKNQNYQATWYNIPYKITTTIEEYRLAIYWCIEYSSNSKQLGIWSLYIIKEEDYPTPTYTYRGDGLWTPGINIGKVYDESE